MTNKTNNGISAYQGYEYQILATVWIALELIFKYKFCDMIVVEPASGEDIAADLNVDPEKANGKIEVSTNEKNFEIQVKLRQSGHWTLSKFKDVIQGKKKEKGDRGPDQRKRPLDILRSSLSTNYVFLTNAQIQSDLHLFEIKKIGEKSKAVKIPDEPEVSSDRYIAQRIGILSQCEEKRLNLEIDEILRIKGYVPTHKCVDCRNKLKEAVRARLLGQSEPFWKREEIAAEIQKLGGSLLTVIQNPIQPDNYDEIIQQILEQHKLLLSGPPGTGKTFIAEHIVHQHRLDENPFEVVTESKGIPYIRECLNRQGRFLFFINDPWGQYKLSQDADKWADELPKLLKSAGTNKRFIITTRIGIKNQIIDDQIRSELTLAERLLTEKQYGNKQREAILKLASKNCNSWQNDIIKRNHKLIIDELRVPYSLMIFANQLSRIKLESDVNIVELLRKSNIPSIGSSLAKEITEMGKEAVVSAVVLWAFIMTNKTLREGIAQKARHIVRSGGYDRSIDTLKLFRWLVSAKWFQDTSGNVTAHPTVLDGLESLIDNHPGITEDVLVALLNGLVSEGKFPTTLKIIKQLKNRNLPIPGSVQAAINIFLLRQLKKATGYKYREAFFELSKWSTAVDPVSHLVHLLAERKKTKSFDGSVQWVKPELTKSEINEISLSEDALECAANFIKEIIPSEHFCPYSASELVDFFNQFQWDMSNNFLTAAKTAIERGAYELDVPIKATFLYPSPDYDSLLKAVFRAYDDTEIWWKEYQKEYQKAQQAEVNASYASHITDEPQDRFGPIETALKVIVFHRREKEGYRWIEKHHRFNDLLESWVNTVDESTSIKEINAILEKGFASDQRLAWKAIQKSKRIKLADRIASGLVDSPENNLKTCIEILCDFLTPDQLQELVLPVINPIPFVRKATIWHFAASFNPRHKKTVQEIFPLIKSTLSDDEYQCIKACHNISEDGDKSCLLNTDAKYDIMRQILLKGVDTLSIRAAFVLAENKKQFDDHLPLLFKSTNVAVRVNAIALAGSLCNRLGRKLLRRAMNDENYKCRRASMLALASQANSKDRKHIVSKSGDPSAPVRETCAELIGEYGWIENQSTLLKLLEDKRDFSEDELFRTHTPKYNVARAAANSFSNMEQLPQTIVDDIFDFLKKRDEKKDDIVVHYQLLEVISAQKMYGKNIVLLFEKFLNDSWYMPGIKHKGFPLRYAAAWGILIQLSINNSLKNDVSIEKLYQGAIHNDNRLAGPCLCCLGLIGNKAQNKILQLLQTENMTSDRALLILWTLPDNCGIYLKDSLVEFVGKDNPKIHFFQLSDQFLSFSEEDWKLFLIENAEVAKWIEELKNNEDIFPLLRFIIHHSFEKGIAEIFFKYDDCRKHDLAESIPVMTTRSMFGGE